MAAIPSRFVKVYIETSELTKLFRLVGRMLPEEGCDLEEGCVYRDGYIEYHVIEV